MTEIKLLNTVRIFYQKSTLPYLTINLREQKEKERRFLCRHPGCSWGPGTTSARTKHEKRKHKNFDPIHIQDGGIAAHSSGLHIVARDQKTGQEYSGDLGPVCQRTLSPLVTNLIDDQAEEATGSDDSITSEPMHSSDSGDE